MFLWINAAHAFHSDHEYGNPLFTMFVNVYLTAVLDTICNRYRETNGLVVCAL